MLKSVRFVNWKSFRDATLHIDPLTVLIGANASGKSNAIEGLQFLSRLAQGTPVETALAGNDKLTGLRGGTDWAGFRGADQIQFDVLMSDKTDFVQTHVVQIKPYVWLKQSVLKDTSGQVISDLNEWKGKYAFFSAVVGFASIVSGKPLDVRSLTDNPTFRKLHPLYDLFVLEPDPSQMRLQSSKADLLVSDGRNVAGVISALPADEQKTVLDQLSSLLSQLPEFQVKRVFIEKYGLHKNDAMLCCDEPWGYPIDARCMSDGTLRFVAILTAILTLPKGSLLVIEDVDTGIHPSRAGLILEVLRTEGKRRGVDVLVTTHNVAFLDALPPEMAPFVTVAYRDGETGETHLKPLDELGAYGRILAAGSIGRAVARGVVEQAVRAEPPAKGGSARPPIEGADR